MKSWEGCILTGRAGASILERMSEKAQLQALQRSIETTGRTYKSYSPWMSNAAMRPKWSSLHVDHIGPTIPTIERLKDLADAFNDHGPLKAIDPSNTDREVNFDQSQVITLFRERASRYIGELSGLGDDYGIRLRSLVQEVIPLRKIRADMPVRFDGEGMTTQCYRGGVFLTLAHASERNHCEDLLNIIHEVGHQAFNLILCSDQVVEGDIYSPAYSPVRKTMRPGILAVHALVAVVYMVELMVRCPHLFLKHSDRNWVGRRFAGLLADFEFGLASMRSLPLTSIGLQLAEEFESLHRFASRECHEYKTS